MKIIYDIGNTTIKAAAFEQDKLIKSAQKKHNHEHEKSQIISQFTQLNENLDIKNLNLVKPIVHLQKRNLSMAEYRKFFILEVEKFYGTYSTLEHPLKTLLNIDYRPSNSDLGTDRIADCEFARKVYGGSFITVNMGSAWVINVVTDNAFRGGLIFANPISNYQALINITGLPQYKFEQILHFSKEDFIGNSTIEAVSIGAIREASFAINEFILLIQNKLLPATKKDNVIVTGGFYPYYLKYLAFKHRYEPNLTLLGLYELAKINSD